MQARIAVVGAGECSSETSEMAWQVGKHIAENGAILICGGGGGVMRAAAKGAKEYDGITIGILPGISDREANPYIDIPIVTGMGQARNVVVVQSAHAVIAVKGGYGTLAEIAVALKSHIPIVGLNSWNIDARVRPASDPEDAVGMAFSLIHMRYDG